MLGTCVGFDVVLLMVALKFVIVSLSMSW